MSPHCILYSPKQTTKMITRIPPSGSAHERSRNVDKLHGKPWKDSPTSISSPATVAVCWNVPKVVFAFIPLLPFIGVRQSVSGSGSKIIGSRSSATCMDDRRKRPVDCDYESAPRVLANQCVGGKASLRQSPLTDRPPVSNLLRRATPALGTSRSEIKSAPSSSKPSRCFARCEGASAGHRLPRGFGDRTSCPLS